LRAFSPFWIDKVKRDRAQAVFGLAKRQGR